jgi:hypothetical protein
MSEDKVVKLGSKRNNKKEQAPIPQEKEFVPSRELINCSFCGRSSAETLKMVKGPGVNICAECTMIAVQYLILNDRVPSAEAQMILDAFWGKAK